MSLDAAGPTHSSPQPILGREGRWPRGQVVRKGKVTSPLGVRQRTQGQCPEAKQSKGHFKRKVLGTRKGNLAITRDSPGAIQQTPGTRCSKIFSSQSPRPLLPELCLDSESQRRAEWMDQSEAHSLIRARKQLTNYSMICHHLRTQQVFVPERIDTWREKGHIF